MLFSFHAARCGRSTVSGTTEVLVSVYASQIPTETGRRLKIKRRDRKLKS